MAKHNKIGELGEKIATRWLENRGYKTIDRNYRKKWGEIDIVAKKGNTIYFVEVKSTTRDLKAGESGDKFRPKTEKGSVRSTNREDDWFRPEENVHPKKLQRLYRTIETYLSENEIGDLPGSAEAETGWQLDLAVVYIDEENKLAKVKYLENIVG